MAEIAKIGRHTTIRGLARSLFDLGEEADGLRGAEAALLAANPGLSDATGFKPGAPVIVPDRAGGRGAGTKADAAGQAQDEMARQLAALAERAAQALEADAAEAKESAEALRSSTVAGVIRKRFPDVADQLPEIARAAADRAKGVAARQELVKAVLAQAEKDLAALGQSRTRKDGTDA